MGKLCEKNFLGDGATWRKIRKNPNKIGVFGGKKKICVGGLTRAREYIILEAIKGAWCPLGTRKENEMKQAIELRKIGVWHDDGDDGVTGWQPIKR